MAEDLLTREPNLTAIYSACDDPAIAAATTNNARVELDRRMDLARRELISKSERDQAQTAFDTAQAQLAAHVARGRHNERGRAVPG